MILSLDTNVLVDVANGEAGVRARYDAAVEEGMTLVASVVAACEFQYGAMISPRPQVHGARAEALLADLGVEPWTYEDALATARLKKALRSRGEPIGAYDVMIAGQALSRGWAVVSHNLKHFLRADGLNVIDWKEGADG